MEENEIQAYQSIIDFNKTIITICSSILTAFIGFIIYQNIALSTLNYAVLGLFVIAIFVSLYGFGSTIAALRDKSNSNTAILMTNISAVIMIVGIILISTIKIQTDHDLTCILSEISTSTKSLGKHLDPNSINQLKFDGDKYHITFKTDSIFTNLTYSITDKKIVSIELKPSN